MSHSDTDVAQASTHTSGILYRAN